MKLDIIGDIHGHADKLEALLHKLGYTVQNGIYRNTDRKVLFLGDYIDRGPQIRAVLELVRGMVEADTAIALMGNHEYNALCFHFQESEGGHLRKHLIKNIVQHYETLRQFQNEQEVYEDYLEWFKSLPLFLETEQFNAVHACWDANHIQYLKEHLIDGRLNDDLIYKSVCMGTPLYRAVNNALKGREIQIPNGLTFTDKDGTKRTQIRIKWWENPLTTTCRNLSVEPLSYLPDVLMDPNSLRTTNYYMPTLRPVFFGHYWLKGEPTLYRDNICCLDYSVARHGHLAAYRYDGETVLNAERLVFV
jgi:hypothetical protein